jgi:hypothetical protein
MESVSGRFENWHKVTAQRQNQCILNESSGINPMQVALTMVSSNVKTGPIPTTTSERSSCWEGCAFYDKGCYAKSGPQALHWRKISEGERGLPWNEFVSAIRKIAKGQIWRHNVSGDLPHVFGDIDADKTQQLVNANRGRRGYTYTHHPLNDHNINVIRECNSKGFTVNASTESVEVADKVMTEHGIPAVAVVNSEESRRFFRTESGRKVVVCPAMIHDSVTCATCGLCQKADREFVIAFPAHGTAKKTVNSIVAI